MTASMGTGRRPGDALLVVWSGKSGWSHDEARALALGAEPGGVEVAKQFEARLEELVLPPATWLQRGEEYGFLFHADWWLRISPAGPIGFDGRHFALNRSEILSEAFREQERRLISDWARKPYWTLREAIDLSLNFEPGTTNGWRGDAPETGETIRERDDRAHIAQRAVELGTLDEKVEPARFLRWLDGRGYYLSDQWRRAVLPALALPELTSDVVVDTDKSVDSGLKRQVRELTERAERLERELADVRAEQGHRIAAHEGANVEAKTIEKLRKELRLLTDGCTSPTDKAAVSKNRATLQKALLAAAVDGYGYDPRHTRSDVPQQIADKAADMELGITAQTIRNTLREASDIHVGQNVWEKIHSNKTRKRS
ncbi:hypothetical protein [Tropicimonas aquimaris]|uniref:Uncharacterized protein n=1 Tax=Tropicimonas aquimaris TaxID=914152 RepID=A0ABW3IJM9_9RHOB